LFEKLKCCYKNILPHNVPEFLDKIEKAERSFIWGNQEGGKKMHVVSWNTITRPKVYGGITMCNLKHMNLACNMKLGWMLRNDGNSLWCQVLKGKYARQGLISSSLIAKPQDSLIWKFVVEIWPQLVMGLGLLEMGE